MTPRLVLLAVAAVLVAAGCGGHSQRKAIAGYITSVDSVERSMAAPLQEVSVANQSYARNQTNPHLKRKLAASVATLRRLRRRLARVQAPPEATHLRALLLTLVDREIALAVEEQQLAAFVPRYRDALVPIQRASDSLKTELASSAKGAAAAKKLNAAKADALDAYAGTLANVATSLRSLDPPPVWRPTYEQQLASLADLRSASSALAAAIRANSAAAVPHLLERFDAAAVENRSVGAQKREIAAVTRYNRRIHAIARLAKRVQLERVALQKRYG